MSYRGIGRPHHYKLWGPLYEWGKGDYMEFEIALKAARRRATQTKELEALVYMFDVYGNYEKVMTVTQDELTGMVTETDAFGKVIRKSKPIYRGKKLLK